MQHTLIVPPRRIVGDRTASSIVQPPVPDQVVEETDRWASEWARVMSGAGVVDDIVSSVQRLRASGGQNGEGNNAERLREATRRAKSPDQPNGKHNPEYCREQAHCSPKS